MPAMQPRIVRQSADVRRAFLSADVVGPREIAGRLHVKVSAVSNWQHRSGVKPPFPRPVAEVSGVPLFTWGAVENWAARTGRLLEVRSGEVTEQDMADAAEQLESARHTVREEVSALARQTAELRENAIRAPRRAERGAGEYDWLETAPRRARRFLVSDVHALTPDVYFDTIAHLLPADATFADAMAAWLTAWDLLTSANALAHGQAPDYVPDGLSFDAAALYGPGALVYLAGVLADERERRAAYGDFSASITDTGEEAF